MNNSTQVQENAIVGSRPYLESIFKPWLEQEYRDRIYWICRQVSGHRVLDVGCGTQLVSAVTLAQRGVSVTAIDADERTLAEVRKEFDALPDGIRERIELLHADIFTFVPDERFDTIIFANVLSEFPDLIQALERASELVRFGGAIVITAPFGEKLNGTTEGTLDLLTFQNVLPNLLSLEDVTIVDLTIRAVLRRDDQARRWERDDMLKIMARGMTQAQLYLRRKSDWLQDGIKRRNQQISGQNHMARIYENRIAFLNSRVERRELLLANSKAAHAKTKETLQEVKAELKDLKQATERVRRSRAIIMLVKKGLKKVYYISCIPRFKAYITNKK